MKKSYKSIFIVSLFSVLVATNAASAAGQLDPTFVAEILRERKNISMTKDHLSKIHLLLACAKDESDLTDVTLTKCCVLAGVGDEAACKQQTLDIVAKSVAVQAPNSGSEILCGQNMIRLEFGQSRDDNEFLFESKANYDMVKDNIQGLDGVEEFRHSDTYVNINKGKVYECDNGSCTNGTTVEMSAGHVFKGQVIYQQVRYRCDNNEWKTVDTAAGVCGATTVEYNNQSREDDEFLFSSEQVYKDLNGSFKQTKNGQVFECDNSACQYGEVVTLPAGHVFKGQVIANERSYKCRIEDFNDYWVPLDRVVDSGIQVKTACTIDSKGVESTEWNNNKKCVVKSCQKGYDFIYDKDGDKIGCKEIKVNTPCQHDWKHVKEAVYNADRICVPYACEDGYTHQTDKNGKILSADCIEYTTVEDVVIVGKQEGAPCSPEDLERQNATAGHYINNGVEISCFATACPSGAYLVKVDGAEMGYCYHESACTGYTKLNIIDGKYTDRQCVREKFEPLTVGKVTTLGIPTIGQAPALSMSTFEPQAKSESQINADNKRQEVAQDIANIDAQAQAKKDKILQEAAEDAERERLGLNLIEYDKLKKARKELGESAPAVDINSLDEATRKKLERVDIDAQKDKERAIEKYEKSVERDAERAERKAERAAEKAERDAERAAEQQKKQAGLDVLADAQKRAAEKKQAVASAQTSETTSGASQQSAPSQPAGYSSDSEFVVNDYSSHVRCQTLISQGGGWVEAGNKCIKTTGTPSSSTSSTAGVSSAATTARQDRNEQLKQQERAAPAYEPTQSATKSAVSESGVWTKVYEFERKISPDDVNTEAMALEQRVISTARGDYARENGVTSGFYSEVNVVDKKRTYNFQDGIANFMFKVELKISK